MSQTPFGSSFALVHGPWSAGPTERRRQSLLGEYLVVPDGERYAAWDRYGLVTWVDGPASRLLFGGFNRPLLEYVAGPGQFILLTLKSGKSEIVEGPAAIWEDPVKQASAQVFSSMEISTNEAIVVYSPDGDAVTRRIVKGPTLYTPANSQEWIHQFKWHGTDHEILRSTGLNRKRPGGLVFTKLRMVPDQLYYDVEKVRTKDDALLVVKTMVFFRLVDIDKMVEATHDPVSDLVNSISADIIAATSVLSFEEFRANANNLNELPFYPTLLAAAEKLGYEITKMVFRGYEASKKLQLMHDEAIEQRTRLILMTESEEQTQGLEDLRQEKSQQRASKDREEEERSKQHKLKMEEMAHRASLLVDRLNAEQEESLKKTAVEGRLAEAEQQTRAREIHLKALREMDVDLNTYLSQKADKIIRLEGSAGGASPHLHLGEGEQASKL